MPASSYRSSHILSSSSRVSLAWRAGPLPMEEVRHLVAYMGESLADIFGGLAEVRHCMADVGHDLLRVDADVELGAGADPQRRAEAHGDADTGRGELRVHIGVSTDPVGDLRTCCGCDTGEGASRIDLGLRARELLCAQVALAAGCADRARPGRPDLSADVRLAPHAAVREVAAAADPDCGKRRRGCGRGARGGDEVAVGIEVDGVVRARLDPAGRQLDGG